MSTTEDPNDLRRGHGYDTEPVPQNEVYLVLPEEDRKRGFTRPYRTTYRHTVCGYSTTMGRLLAETHARDPQFYDSTYCVHCRAHRPVDEFVWVEDDTVVGS